MTKEERAKYKEAAKRGKSKNNNFVSDKERYEKELKSLTSHSDNLKKPKKCLSAYMIFVKEVSYIIFNLFFLLDTTLNCWRKSRDGSTLDHVGGW